MTQSSQDANTTKRLDIRKYPNRRYYDATRSRHLTLEEIHSAIRDGHEVTVTDSKSGRDITANVLAQIILELDTPKLSVFPVPLLHRLLRSNERLVQDFTDKYFSRALSAFLDSQKQFEQYLRQSLGLQSSVPTAADWARMIWGPFNPTLWGNGGPPTEGPAAAPPAASGEPAQSDLQPVVDDLKRQVTELQRQLNTMKKPRRRRK